MDEYIHQVSEDEPRRIQRFLRWFAIGVIGFASRGRGLFTRLIALERVETRELQGFEMLSTHPDIQRRIDYLNDDADARGWTTGPVQPYPAHIADPVRLP